MAVGVVATVGTFHALAALTNPRLIPRTNQRWLPLSDECCRERDLPETLAAPNGRNEGVEKATNKARMLLRINDLVQNVTSADWLSNGWREPPSGRVR